MTKKNRQGKPREEQERIRTSVETCSRCNAEDEFCYFCCGSGMVWVDQDGYGFQSTDCSEDELW